MPRIAILEDAKRRSTRLTREQREKAIQIITNALRRRGEIILAIVFGGVLVEEKPIRDIDVAIYTGYRVKPGEWPSYVDELRTVLEKELHQGLGLRKAVDIVLLEYAPPRLRATILKEGRVIIDRSPGLRALLLLHSLDDAKAMERTRKRLSQ